MYNPDPFASVEIQYGQFINSTGDTELFSAGSRSSNLEHSHLKSQMEDLELGLQQDTFGNFSNAVDEMAFYNQEEPVNSEFDDDLNNEANDGSDDIDMDDGNSCDPDWLPHGSKTVGKFLSKM